MSAGAFIAQAGSGPASQCLAVHSWLTVVVGVLLPLCVAARQELRGRQQLMHSMTTAQLPPAERRAAQEQHSGQVQLLRLFSIRNLYLASCLVSGAEGWAAVQLACLMCLDVPCVAGAAWGVRGGAGGRLRKGRCMLAL